MNHAERRSRSWLPRLSGWFGSEARDERLLTRAEFFQLLRRERARTDRTASPFSIVEIKFDAVPHGLSQLLLRLQQRLRLQDQMGWLTRRSVAVFLPDTPFAGGESVAIDIERILVDLEIAASLRVYCYPVVDSDRATSSGDERSRLIESAELLMCQPETLFKRTMDWCGAALGLILLSPLMLIAACMIRVSSPGPIIYRQRRVGRGGKDFEILKFRTMVENADALHAGLLSRNEQDGPAFKMHRDPRVTPVGVWLRRFHIDELPQLWNVLRGEMSLVGPRPLPAREMNACETWQRERLLVRPGLTCFWQLKKHLRPSFDEWMRMDIDYVRRASVMLDIALVARTIWFLLTGGERLPAPQPVAN